MFTLQVCIDIYAQIKDKYNSHTFFMLKGDQQLTELCDNIAGCNNVQFNK